MSAFERTAVPTPKTTATTIDAMGFHSAPGWAFPSASAKAKNPYSTIVWPSAVKMSATTTRSKAPGRG